MRVSISTSYWPLIWPAPEQATVTLLTGLSSYLSLPVRAPRPEDDALPDLGTPEGAPDLEVTPLATGAHSWQVTRDLATDVSTLEILNDQGKFRIEETGTMIHRDTSEWHSFRWNDVTSVRGETRTVRRFERDDWRTEISTRTVLTSDAESFFINAQLDAYELAEERGNPRVWSQNWDYTIPRDLV